MIRRSKHDEGALPPSPLDSCPARGIGRPDSISGMPDHRLQVLSIARAIDLAISTRPTQSEHQTNQIRASALFLAYAQECGLRRWQQLRAYHVQRFLRDVSARYSPNYVHSIGNVLAVACRFVADNYPEQATPIPVRHYLPKRQVLPKRYLSLDQVLACIHYAEDNGDRAAALGFALGGLAGLRLTEAMRLTPDSVQGDVLAIVETKNDASKRLIPLCSEALRVLKAHKNRYNAQRYRGEHGQFYRNTATFSHRMRVVLDAMADATGDESYRLCSPHDGARKSFVNACVDAGISQDWIRSYVGHAGANVTERHYWQAAPRPDDMPRTIERGLRLLREQIVTPLEREIARAQKKSSKGKNNR